MADENQQHWRIVKCKECLFAGLVPHAHVFLTCEHSDERMLIKFFSLQSCRKMLMICIAKGLITDEEAMDIYMEATTLGIPEVVANLIKELRTKPTPLQQ